MEQNVDAVTLPSLGVPEPQMGNQLVERLQKIDTPSLTFLSLVVEVNWEVFKVYTVDRVQQRFWSRSPSLLFQMEVYKIFSKSRVPQRLLRFFVDTLVKVFF